MEEDLEGICKIVIRKEGDEYVAVVETQLGGEREFVGEELEEVLRDMINVLEDEFEGRPDEKPI